MKHKTIYGITTPEIKKIDKKQDVLSEKWDKLKEQMTEIEAEMKVNSQKILELQRVEFRKGYKPKFKKGDIMFRDMGTVAGDYSHKCQGMVKLTSDGELDDAGRFHYDCVYVKKNGTPTKNQPSSSVWEHQLKPLSEIPEKKEELKDGVKENFKNRIIKLLKEAYSPVRTSYVSSHNDISNKTTLKLLQELEEEGKIKREVYGSFRSGRTKWSIK